MHFIRKIHLSKIHFIRKIHSIEKKLIEQYNY